MFYTDVPMESDELVVSSSPQNVVEIDVENGNSHEIEDDSGK